MGKKHWTKQIILSEIKKIQQKEEPLNSGYIQKNFSTLHQAALRYFGSWKIALEELGIDYSNVKIRKEWGKDRVIKTILSYHGDGIDLSSRGIRRYDHKLYSVARHHYGTWENAIKAAGLDYDKIRKRAFISADWVLRQIKERHFKNKPLNAGYINKNHSKLMNAARRHFKSWEGAIREAGLDYNKIKQPPGIPSIWNEITIPAKIGELYENNQDISYKAMMRAGYQALLAQSKSVFGSYGAAVEEAGIDYDEIIKIQRWGNGKAVIETIRELKDAGEPLNDRHIRRFYNKLMNAANRYFNGWGNAIRAAGLNYDEIKTREEWDPNRILEEIRNLAAQDHRLRPRETYQSHSKLVDAARNHFGSWKNAVMKAGFEYQSYNQLEIALGLELEKIAKKIFIDILGFNYEYKPWLNKKQPDFFDRDTETWIDIKLSAWSPGIKKDIKNYLPYAKRLKFIYLLGEHSDQEDEKIGFQCIKDYYADLIEYNREDIVRELSLIEKRVLPTKQQTLD